MHPEAGSASAHVTLRLRSDSGRRSPEREEGAGTYLDVRLPHFLKEEADAVVVLERVKEDDPDPCARNERNSASGVWWGSEKAHGLPPGVSQAETVHSWNLSIDLRYLME